jgi:hypothetical protein
VVVTPASAATPSGALTVTPASVAGGATTSVTVTASWTATNTNVTETVMTMPAALVAAGATWTSASLSAGQSFPDCVLDSPSSQAACQWTAAVVGATTTMTAVLQLPAGVVPGAYVIEAEESFEATAARTVTLTVLSDSTPAIAVSPTSTTPGSTATATGTFTAQTTGDIRVNVNLQGTSGNGTFGTASSTTGLTNCSMDGTLRSYSCTWENAVVGETRSIVIPVQVAPGTPDGASFQVEACSNPNTAAADCESTTLAIAVAPTPTATPTATATPTPTGTTTPSSSASPSTVPVPTAVPAGDGPAQGGGAAPLLLLAAVIALVGGSAWALVRRRA